MSNEQLAREQCVKVCPQCEGEGTYADGLDEAACSTECTRCGSNGWIVDLAALRAAEPAADDDWQTIDTAPKDGTLIDVWLEPIPERMAMFVNGSTEGRRLPNAWYVEREDYTGFRNRQSFNGREINWRATHWRLPPRPPSAALQAQPSQPAADVVEALKPFARYAASIPEYYTDDRIVSVEVPLRPDELPEGTTSGALVVSLDGLKVSHWRKAAAALQAKPAEPSAEVPVKAEYNIGRYPDGSGPMVQVRYDTTGPSDSRADCRDKVWLETSSNNWIAFDHQIADELCTAIKAAAGAIAALRGGT